LLGKNSAAAKIIVKTFGQSSLIIFSFITVRPKLTLTLDQNEIVTVGSTIKLNCDAKANPKVTEIHWLFNDHIIEQSQSRFQITF